MGCPKCDCLPYHAVFQAVKQGGLGKEDAAKAILRVRIFRELRVPEVEIFHYWPNCTVTCAPADTCVPAGGDCWRAKPLPMASSSRPASWAASTAPRTVLPTNDGTSIPPCSTSNTTVPVAGSLGGAEAISGLWAGAWPGSLDGAGAGSLCRIAASTTCPSAWVVAGAGPP